jgi:hypothetical protein
MRKNGALPGAQLAEIGPTTEPLHGGRVAADPRRQGPALVPMTELPLAAPPWGHVQDVPGEVPLEDRAFSLALPNRVLGAVPHATVTGLVPFVGIGPPLLLRPRER